MFRALQALWVFFCSQPVDWAVLDLAAATAMVLLLKSATPRGGTNRKRNDSKFDGTEFA